MFRKLSLFLTVFGVFFLVNGADAQKLCPAGEAFNATCGQCVIPNGECSSPVLLGPTAPQEINTSNPLIHIDQAGAGPLIRLTKGDSKKEKFVINNNGQAIFGDLSSTPTGVDVGSGQNLLYGLLDSGAQGNALMLQRLPKLGETGNQNLFTLNKDGHAAFGGYDPDTNFAVTTPSLYSANICLGLPGDCRTSWPTGGSADGEPGFLQFSNGSGAFGGTSDLFWNNTAKRLILGITEPATNKAKMYIYNNAMTGNDPALVVDGGTDSNQNYHGIQFNTLMTKRGEIIQEATGNLYVRSTKNLILNDSSTGSVGIGTTSPATGTKLDVVGKVKITDGTQGANKVLTSDATGLASWVAPAVVAGVCPDGQFVTAVGGVLTCALPPSGGTADNLGNHTATQNIQLGSFNIVDGIYSVDPSLTSVLNQVKVSSIFDKEDPLFFVNPNDLSRLQSLQVSTISDIDNTAYYVDPSYGSKFFAIQTGELDSLGNISTAAGNIYTTTGTVSGKNITAITAITAPNITASATVTAPIFYDTNFTFYIDPSLTSNINSLYAASIFAPKFFDRDNSALFVDPSATSFLNEVQVSKIIDRDEPSYFVDPNSQSVFSYLTVVGSVTAARFPDKDNVAFYVDPASTSVLNTVDATVLGVGTAVIGGTLSVGGTANVVGRVSIAETDDATLTGGGGLQIAPGNGANLVFDGNEIQARNDGAASPLYLNHSGGAVYAGGNELVNGSGDVRLNNIAGGDFAATGVRGALILGIDSTFITCGQVCEAHSLSCVKVDRLNGAGATSPCEGNASGEDQRYCWCE